MEYSKMVADLAKDGADIIKELSPEKAHAWHMASALNGEAGEAFDIIKKWVIYNRPLTTDNVEHLIEELGDIEFYLEGLRQVFRISREEVLEANQNKLLKKPNARYKEGKYSNEAAQTRRDKK